ncbi:saccharopine dehydrogenase a, tandem duplicate 1 [Carcharodon carcharias]|uniref:saccharopine dehydrogenase a, tandem duplicate 1 n=1 Tax=Carcharodon carcharias TaxID=13397 RepID=UPI001B7F1C01|nr:saccharopine dehydrogenase a, tandem duplicate 1 [Carcharodon carcharias]
MATGRPYDLIIFGASGFTGQFVVEEAARVASETDSPRPLTWTVAGRNRVKLEGVLERAASALGTPELKSKEYVVCDINDPLSLDAMCQQGSVILNCVGPYRFFGEPVVKACIENGTHCVDVSGEPQFLEGMQLKYDHQAAEKGVYIVGSCGFDSIPADMGILYTRNQLKGTLTAVESFVLIKSGPEGASLHDGTWQSAVHGMSDQDNLRKLRRQFGHKPLPVIGTKLRRRGSVFYSNTMNQYAIPFIGSDASVVKRTQRYLYENLQESPVQYGAYSAVGGIGSVILLMIAGFFFWCFTKFRLGRNLLIKYPEFFSFGYFTRQGPTKKQMEGTSFSMTFFGEGYQEDQDPQQGKPSVKICTQVKGPEPGYIATPIAMVQAAVTILWEHKSLPNRGGVYSPGAAFSKTTLIERLNKHGIEFTVISKPEA